MLIVYRPKLSQDYGRLKLYIDGQFKDSISEEFQKIYDPGLGMPIGEVPFALKEEVDEAVSSAAAAYEEWKELPIEERVKYLYRMRRCIEEHFDELAKVNTQNHGKTLSESEGDLKRLLENIDAAIGVAFALSKGEVMDQVSDGIDEFYVREPLGVFAVITPFNFPLMIPFWFIPYALVLGNTVVVKPSEVTPLPMTYLMGLLHEEVKLPPGVLNVVHGSRGVVEGLISNRDVKGVAFVGSSPVARQVYKFAGEHGKRALVQGGAKNSIVVMPDADLNRWMGSIVSSFFGNAGQRCLAGSNLLVHEDIKEETLSKFVGAARALRVGYGFSRNVDMGPVVTEAAKKRILGYVEKGMEEGAKLVLDGRSLKVPEYPMGFYLGPTVFDDVTPDMTIAREEIFGPVASVMTFSDLDEAVSLINKGTNYGNMACIFTSNGGTARRFRRSVLVGNVGINVGVAAPVGYFPFAGMRDSFFGVVHGQIDCVDFFTDKKVVISRW